MKTVNKTKKILIVGCGISGCVLAERYANLKNKKVLIIDKRNQIGGNCYDYTNDVGITVSKYGAHIFHTNYDDVWNYVNRFSKWKQYTHRVVAFVDKKLVPVPVNINTINLLMGEKLKNENDMVKWLKKNTIPIKNPKNGEEAALRRVGKILYEKIFKNYTKKQWGIFPKNLDAEVLDRIPIRLNFDNQYFSDKYQALPKKGYTEMFKRMLKNKNITVKLNTCFKNLEKNIPEFEKIFFTGPIDQFFNYKFGKKLEYRSLRFKFENFNKKFFQDYAVINYPNKNKYTRIVEYKHFTGQKNNKTTISKEYSNSKGEPYYPILNKKNRKTYSLYEKEAKKLQKNGIYFVGRLANFKYFNMDQAFKNALELFNQIESGVNK